MKKYKYITSLRLLFICFIAVFLLCSCSSKKNKNVEDLVKDTYGDQTFKISFYQENLDEVIDDIYYSAYNMPKLPQPTKLGYIFEGWFYDIDYTIPYEDGSLYLYMQNVVLYAKFSEEEFIANGIYDIEYDCYIVEDSIEKSELTDTYGLKDITEDLVKDSICIEKNENGKFLKFVYDCNVTVSMQQNDPYNVLLDARMSLKSKITDSIMALNDPVKTLFIDISNLKIDEEIYLFVTSYNYDYSFLGQNEILKTEANYVVCFKITKLLGFRTGFENTKNILDNGTYLVKTFYRTTSNESSMMDSFNSVYAYLYAKDGKYKLVKQFYPYEGMVGTSSINNYYSRMISFGPINLFFKLNNFDYKNREKRELVNVVQEYDAKNYGNFTTEFDSTTGRYYYIYDLEDDYKKPVYQEMSVTGYMEVASAMGSVSAIMYIDLDSVIKINNPDYKEIYGEKEYVFMEEFDYYPSNSNDLINSDKTYDSTIKYGVANYFYNTIYEASNINDVASRKYHSFKMEIIPDYSGNLTDSKGVVNKFIRKFTVYDYDGVSNLYADTMAVKKFGSAGLRKNIVIKNGKSFNVGDSVNLEELFIKKIDNSVDFNNVNCTIYNYNGKLIDYNNPYKEINTFTSKCIVFFEYENKFSTLILDLYTNPIIEIKDYDELDEHVVGETVSLPNISYNWMGYTYSFTDNYYASGDGDLGLDPMRTFYYYDDGYKYVRYIPKDTIKMSLDSEKTVIVFEFVNQYNERLYKEYRYNCKGSRKYEIIDDNNNIVASDSLKLKNGDESLRERISVSKKYTELIYNLDDLDEVNSFKFYLSIYAKSYELYNELEFDSVKYVSKNESIKYYLEDFSSKEELINFIKEKAKNDGYAYFGFYYTNYSNAVDYGKDTYYINYAYNIKFNGEKQFDVIKEDIYFLNNDYIIALPFVETNTNEVVGLDGSYNISNNIDKYLPSNIAYLGNDKYQCILNVKKGGLYYLNYSLSIRNTNIFMEDVSIYLYDEITMYDGLVDITYHTDDLHVFIDGALEKTITYNPYEDISLLGANEYDVTTKSKLFGYYQKADYDPSKDLCLSTKAFNYTKKFQKVHIDLYAYFDDGIKLTVNYSSVNGTTYSPLILNYYRGQSSSCYEIDLYSLNLRVPPTGYVFAGLTGGFLGDELYVPVKNEIFRIKKAEDIILYAIYKKECIISYGNREEISTHIGKFKANDIILEGDKLQPLETVDEYVFVGYYIFGDESMTLLDLSTFIVTDNLKLVAVFEAGD